MVMTINLRRLGRFSIDVDMIEREDLSINDSPEVRAIMACCTIVRAEMDYASYRINYVALSTQFAPVNQGAEVPCYQWIIERAEPLGQITARVGSCAFGATADQTILVHAS